MGLQVVAMLILAVLLIVWVLLGFYDSVDGALILSIDPSFRANVNLIVLAALVGVLGWLGLKTRKDK